MWILAIVSFSLSVFFLKYLTIRKKNKTFYQAYKNELKITKWEQ